MLCQTRAILKGILTLRLFVRKNMLIILTQAVAYFLAGSFLIGTVISLQSDNGAVEPINWFTGVVGGILIVAGFVLAVSTLPFTRLQDFFKNVKDFSERWVFPILFAVTTTQILKTIFDFREIKPLFIITIIFLVIVLFAIVVTSKRLFQHIPSLLSLSLIFNVLAIVLIPIGAERIQVITILTFSSILLLLTVLKFSRERDSKKGTYDDVS